MEPVKLHINTWEDLTPAYPGLEAFVRAENAGELEFRLYQALAVLSWHLNGGRGVIRAATGSGKTAISAAIAGSMLPRKTLVLVHGQALLQQTFDYFQKLFQGATLPLKTQTDTQQPSHVNDLDTSGEGNQPAAPVGKPVMYSAEQKLLNVTNQETRHVHIGLIHGSTFDPGDITIASVDTLGYYLGELSEEQMNNLRERSSRGIADFKRSHRETQKIFDAYLTSKTTPVGVEVLIFDECHHGSAQTWQTLGEKCTAFYRAGLSGTPLKQQDLDDFSMLGLVGPVVYDLDAKWLQDRGYLASARLLIRTLNLATKESRSHNYQDARKNLLISNEKRSTLIAEDIVSALQGESSSSVLVLTGNSVELAENIHSELERLLYEKNFSKYLNKCALATGKMGGKRVSSTFDKLRSGDLRCVITTKLADEGIDVPNIDFLMLVGGGKGYVQAVQRVGRGLRKKKDGRELLVVDYFTKGNRILEKHDKKRLSTYESEGFFGSIDFEERFKGV